jgi:hypothetical protein
MVEVDRDWLAPERLETFTSLPDKRLSEELGRDKGFIFELRPRD